MLYAILCYNDEDAVFAWSKEQEDATMARLIAVQTPLAEAGKLGPVARLMPTTAATTLRKGKNEPIVIDGPFAETKEQLLGFYVVDFETLDEALEFSKELAVANPGVGSYEIRPLYVFRPGTIAT
ncbi:MULTISPECIES: YciI family protein [unclassified Rhizobium]|uniref:YciI family protein n=1 Tax=unclassified Rhizobium TaxID=2613769 RepID=UPI00381CA8F3